MTLKWPWAPQKKADNFLLKENILLDTFNAFF